jgi:hypothetical protein
MMELWPQPFFAGSRKRETKRVRYCGVTQSIVVSPRIR